MLDALGGPQSMVVYSSSNKDEKRLVRWATSEQERKAIVERFKKPEDPLKIIIVCDMLLTGFDAPVEQVMYLDAPLKEHTLLQAIARVNRTAANKTYGLVVDYWGVSDALQEALAIFSPGDVEGAMTPKVDELPRLQARHAAAMNFFAGVKNKRDLDRCVLVLEPEDVRAEFDVAFRRFAQSMDMLLPDPRALEYAGDLAWLGKIRSAARARYRTEQVDISDRLTPGTLVPVASGQGHEGAVHLHQADAVLWAARLDEGQTITVPAALHVHVFVARGSAHMTVDLDKGDAGRLTDEPEPELTATRPDTDVLMWATA